LLIEIVSGVAVRVLRTVVALLCVGVFLAGCGVPGLGDSLTPPAADSGAADSGSGACSDARLLVARGTGEPGTLGFIVGDPLFARLQDQIGEQVSAAPVDYPASSITGDGIRQGVEDVTSQVAAQVEGCPDQQFALAGYSQGAIVITEALRDLPADAAEQVAAVVLFGNPVRAAGTGEFSDRTLDICATGDAICGAAGNGNGNGNGTGHLSYGSDVEDAAAFIVEQFGG
jgi:cutinase